jgi:hypothetical protein
MHDAREIELIETAVLTNVVEKIKSYLNEYS